MKLSDQITRRQLFLVAFGSSQQSGGLTSVDLAATRDENRVIITASDGSAAPVDGADSATAGVLTAADKTKLDELSPTAMNDFGSRSEIAAATIDPASTHLRTAGYSVPGDGGGAVYVRAASEPAHALKVQSTDGAWWEIVPDNGVISFIACGGLNGDTAANGTANVAAFEAFIGYAQTQQLSGAGKWEAGHATLFFPHGHFHFASHLNVKATVRLLGAGGWGNALKDGSLLEWPLDSHGIIVQRHDTIDDGEEVSETFFGDGSVIEGLGLKGGGNTGATGHGIWVRARALVRNCWIKEFAENGISVIATGTSTGANRGNANGWRIEHVQSRSNGRHGIYVIGGDANAGYCLGGDVRSNGRWGIYDSGFLGNTWLACHNDGNGLGESASNLGVTSVVTFSGVRYAANAFSTEAALVATQPGTNPEVWIDVGAGSATANHPEWQAAQPEGTYVHGGPYHADNANAKSSFLGCYREPGQGPNQLESPSFAAGGHMGWNGGYGGVQFDSPHLLGEIQLRASATHKDSNSPSSRNVEGVLNDNAVTPFALKVDGDDSAGLQLYRWNDSEGVYEIRHTNTGWKTPVKITSNLSNVTAGRASNINTGSVIFKQGFWLGDGGPNNNARHHFVGTAAPTGGDHARGDIVWNRTPSAGGKVGWVCVAGGSPGTWKPFGAIDA